VKGHKKTDGGSAWTGKPVAVMGASPGTLGTARAQYHLRQMFVYLNMHAVNQPEVMIAQAHQRFDEKGNLTDETSKKLITRSKKLITRLIDGFAVVITWQATSFAASNGDVCDRDAPYPESGRKLHDHARTDLHQPWGRLPL
jgi:hypothetical protein